MEPLEASLPLPCPWEAAEEARPEPSLLEPKAFFLGVELIFSHLRLKESDRWSEGIALIKLASFQRDFPEVDSAMFVFACEAWTQGATAGTFHAFPTWRELMAKLYRCEAGLANRSWGFRPDLPACLRPTAQQLQMLPSRTQSLLPAADDTQRQWRMPEAHRLWTTADGKPMALRPCDEAPLLGAADNQPPDIAP